MVVYQAWDKAMDLFYWLFILWIVWSWKDVWTKRVAFGLFFYRVTGMLLFWLTQWRPLLLIFPNVFENFVIWSLVLFMLTKKEKFFLTFRQKTVGWISTLPAKQCLILYSIIVANGGSKS